MVDAAAFADLEAMYSEWLCADDTYPLRATIGAYAGNLLSGDPLWLMLVGGSGYGKTETLNVISALPLVYPVSTLSSEAALLSGTPHKERSAGAGGGLLATIGDHGIVVLKDFTSILSKRHDTRAEILGALRECHDGSWSRHVGADGGRVLSWTGKLGMIAGCTTALDRAHAVMSMMGERFVLARMPDVDRELLARAALANRGHEQQMRRQLADAAALLLDMNPAEQTQAMTSDHEKVLVAAASIVTLARSPVERDYQGEIELVLDAEAPTRFVKALAQLQLGLMGVGLTETQAWRTVARVCLDSVPKLRRKCMEALLDKPDPVTTTMVAQQVGHPTRTTRRALEDLVAHAVVHRDSSGHGRADRWELSVWAEMTIHALKEAAT